MTVQETLNHYRGGQLFQIEHDWDGENIVANYKLEMKVYNTLSFPVEIASIIVSLVDENGNRLDDGNFYEREINVRTIIRIKALTETTH